MRLRTKRRIVQVGFSILSMAGALSYNLALRKTPFVYPYLFCYACPFSIAGCPIGLIQDFLLVGACPIYVLGFSFLVSSFVGRGVCGWACPFGFFVDIVGRFGKNIRGKLDDFLKSSKYLVLLILVFMLPLAIYWIPGLENIASKYFGEEKIFCVLCPSSWVFAALPLRLMADILATTKAFLLKSLVFVGVLLGSLLIIRFWCRYLCPYGALIAPTNKLSLLRISLEEERCTRCLLCLEKCPMGTRPNSLDCIYCGECVEACRNKALRFSWGSGKKEEILVAG